MSAAQVSTTRLRDEIDLFTQRQILKRRRREEVAYQRGMQEGYRAAERDYESHRADVRASGIYIGAAIGTALCGIGLLATSLM